MKIGLIAGFAALALVACNAPPAKAHDDNVATLGSCDVGASAFFHAPQYCAYLMDVTSLGNQYAAKVFLDHNRADIYNDYLIDCQEGWVRKMTPPRRQTTTRQAASFDGALFGLVCQ